MQTKHLLSLLQVAVLFELIFFLSHLKLPGSLLACWGLSAVSHDSNHIISLHVLRSVQLSVMRNIFFILHILRYIFRIIGAEGEQEGNIAACFDSLKRLLQTWQKKRCHLSRNSIWHHVWTATKISRINYCQILQASKERAKVYLLLSGRNGLKKIRQLKKKTTSKWLTHRYRHQRTRHASSCFLELAIPVKNRCIS